MAETQTLADRFEGSADFAKYVMRRFNQDRCLRVAASLSYTSLLAMVPVIAIAFAILAGIPALEGVREQIYGFVFQNFLPDTGEKIDHYLQGFVANAGRMTAVGVIGLTAVALMLLATIEAALNIIFRVTRARPLAPRLIIYWALLTLGPLLLGASFSLATYIMTLKVAGFGLEAGGAFSGLGGWVARGLPAVILIFTFSLVYMAVPNRPIRWSHALIGGIVAGVLFSVLRWGFGIYIIYFPTYKAIYGALAAVPIFLLWMYLSWTMVLLGAVVTASLSEWPTARRAGAGGSLGPTTSLILALRILDTLWRASHDGRTLRQSELGVAVGTGGQPLEQMLGRLRDGNFVVSAERRWVLSRDPDSATLYDLAKLLELDIARDLAVARPAGGADATAWESHLAAIVESVGDSQRRAMEISLKDLLSSAPAKAALTAS